MVNVGVDLHKTQFTICIRDSGASEAFGRYPTTDAGYEAFLELAAAWRKQGKEVRVGVESTGNARYFKNRLEAAGVQVIVVNTLKFKVVNESVKKTDAYDAATIAEFLEKDMLPQSRLCSQRSETLRRLLNVRTMLVRGQVAIKNQIHALLTAEGMEDVTPGTLQSKRGRKRTLDVLEPGAKGLAAQPLFELIDRLGEDIKRIEGELEELTAGDRMVELLLTIPGCGKICAWTIRAYTDDIGRFANPKKYASYAGLAPWVQNSNETTRHGRITKRGPKELRTALVQVAMGLRRMLATTASWRLMRRHTRLKLLKGSGKAVIATARTLAVIIWHMLHDDEPFDVGKMTDKPLERKTESMSEESLRTTPQKSLPKDKEPEVKLVERETKKPEERRESGGEAHDGLMESQAIRAEKLIETEPKKKTGVAGKKRLKTG